MWKSTISLHLLCRDWIRPRVSWFFQNKQEKRVGWNKAKDLTPKHNIGVKAPRHKPDTVPRVFV